MSDSQRANPPGLIRATLVRLRQWLAAVAAVLIISTAVVVGLGRLFIPYADQLRPWIEDRLSDRLGQPVTIERVRARWPRLTPQIILDGLRAGRAERPLVEVAEARLELHLPELLGTDRNPFRLVVLGLDLELAEDDEGRWGLRVENGGEFAGTDGDGLAGDLVVRDVEVRISPQGGPRLDLVISEGEVRRRGDRVGLVARAHPAAAPGAAMSLALVAHRPEGGTESVRGRIDLREFRLQTAVLEGMLPDFLTLPADRLDGRMEFDWHRELGSALDLDLTLTGADGFEASARARVERSDERIDAELIELASGGRTLAEQLIVARKDGLWAASVPQLALSDVHGLLSRWLGEWRNWPETVSGDVRDLALLYRHPGVFHRLEGRIGQFGFDLPGDRIGLAGFDLDLGVAGDRAALNLSGSPVIEWPKKMRRDIPIDSIAGRVIVSPRAVQLDGIVGRRPEAEARADGWVWLGNGRPFLDFIVTSDQVDAVDPRPWLPVGEIPPRVMAWLDQALLGVEGASGGLNYHFRLGHKFRQWQSGNFQAWFDFRGAELDYWSQWPVARDLDGRARFVGRSLSGEIDSGRLGGVLLGAEEIVIDDLTAPELSMRLQAEAVEAGELSSVLSAFPIEGWRRFVEPFDASGPVSLQTDLFLPIRRIEDWRLDGTLSFEGATLSLPLAGLRFPDMAGNVGFDRDGMDAPRLDLAGETGEIELSAAFGSPSWLSASGTIPPARLIDDVSPGAELAEDITGASEWRVRLDSHPGGGWQLEARSGLEGVGLQLPPPLVKEAGQSMPLEINVRGHPGGLTLSAGIGDLLNVTAEDAAGRWRLAAGLGQAAPALPAGSGFDVAGRVGVLDLQGWGRLLSQWPHVDAGSAGSGRIRLQVDHLDYGDLSLRDLGLRAHREPEQWRLQLDGESALGEVVVPMPLDSGRVVAVDLLRLDLAHSLAEPPSDELGLSPVPDQTRTHVPTDFPPLHLLVESLRLGELPLGRVRMESHARRDGIEIERVEVSGPHLDLSGYGRWILGDAGPVTEFEGRMISTDLRPLLAALDQGSQFEAARSQIDLTGSWPGAPFDFALARLDGAMELVMLDGTIPEASPGAGRLVGLASLSAMPRRLMLDFRDVFGQGLKFDRIEGRFEVADGIARTDGLRLESPAADITLTGRTDLGARTYDQTVVVEPSVSGTLPVLGGLAGGPAGAAAGLVLRSLLERPLQGIAEARYRVTGDWADPSVELIGARGAEPAATEPDSEPATSPEVDGNNAHQPARPD